MDWSVRGDELFVVETGRRRLLAVDPATGTTRVEAEDVAAGLALGPDGSLHLSADGEGSVLRLSLR